MVDLGQKGWKQFHLFYWNKVKQIDEVLFWIKSKIYSTDK